MRWAPSRPAWPAVFYLPRRTAAAGAALVVACLVVVATGAWSIRQHTPSRAGSRGNVTATLPG
ncbi:hypothetical protein [Hymenobacter nivis]|uniref:hypothetical protein n=1 Tax=Hymenobacter nivis TaxID=1850093 RepID=UPI0011279379|nr:hypothetical protein [Hymenobacter nivis]